MSAQTLFMPRFLTRTKRRTESTPKGHSKPERVEAACLQEQFTGPLPVRNERPAAETLNECLAKTNPAGVAALFIP